MKKWYIKDLTNDLLFKAVVLYRETGVNNKVKKGAPWSRNSIWFVPDCLRALTGAPIELCYNAVEAAVYDSDGPMECGVSFRTGWWEDHDEYQEKLEEFKKTTEWAAWMNVWGLPMDPDEYIESLPEVNKEVKEEYEKQMVGLLQQQGSTMLKHMTIKREE